MKDLTIVLLLFGIGLFALQNHGLRQELVETLEKPEAKAVSEAMKEATVIDIEPDSKDVVASQAEELAALEAKLERAKKLINKLGRQYKHVVAENRRLTDDLSQLRSEIVYQQSDSEPMAPMIMGVGSSASASR